MPNLEGVYVLPPKDRDAVESEPEEGFDDGGGPCDHPQCAIERGLEYSANAIVEGLSAMAFAEWELSPQCIGRLRALAEFLTAMLDEEEGESEVPNIGITYPLPPRDRHDGS